MRRLKKADFLIIIILALIVAGIVIHMVDVVMSSDEHIDACQSVSRNRRRCLPSVNGTREIIYADL